MPEFPLRSLVMSLKTSTASGKQVAGNLKVQWEATITITKSGSPLQT